MAFQDIRRQARRVLAPADYVFLFFAMAAVAALFVLNLNLARTYKGGEWLFLRWSGARAFLFEETEPYGSTVAQRAQTLVYGREAFLNEYPYALNDPFYLVLFYAPLAWLFADFTIVRAVWMLLSQTALIGIVLLTLRLSELESPRWLTIGLILLGVFNYFSLESLRSGSSAILLVFIYLAALSALQSHADELAGVMLFFAAYQWEVGALFFAVVLLLAFANRRWGLFAGFGMTLVVMFLVAFLAKPDWAIAFARAAWFDWTRRVDYTFTIALTNIFPKASILSIGWIAIPGAAILFGELIRAVNAQWRQILWVASLALVLNPFMGFAIFPENHVGLLPAFLLVVLLIRERWKKRQHVVGALSWMILFALSFVMYYKSLNSTDRLYDDLMRIAAPIFALICLYWMRWWAVRPPRLWADQLGARQ
jgi:hypothetical protein